MNNDQKKTKVTRLSSSNSTSASRATSKTSATTPTRRVVANPGSKNHAWESRLKSSSFYLKSNSNLKGKAKDDAKESSAENVFSLKTSDGPFDTPQINKTAQSIFAATPPGQDSERFDISAAFNIPTSRHPILDFTNDIPMAMHEDLLIDLNANDTRDEASSISTHLTGKDKSETGSASEFQIGDLVWARGDDSFPYYPACICPSYFIHTTPRRRKFTVFLYGSDVFDFVSAKNVRRFELFRDEMLHQVLEADMEDFFHLAVSAADEQAKLGNDSRIEYIRQSQNISESLNDDIDVILQPKPAHTLVGNSAESLKSDITLSVPVDSAGMPSLHNDEKTQEVTIDALSGESTVPQIHSGSLNISEETLIPTSFRVPMTVDEPGLTTPDQVILETSIQESSLYQERRQLDTTTDFFVTSASISSTGNLSIENDLINDPKFDRVADVNVEDQPNATNFVMDNTIFISHQITSNAMESSDVIENEPILAALSCNQLNQDTYFQPANVVLDLPVTRVPAPCNILEVRAETQESSSLDNVQATAQAIIQAAEVSVLQEVTMPIEYAKSSLEESKSYSSDDDFVILENEQPKATEINDCVQADSISNSFSSDKLEVDISVSSSTSQKPTKTIIRRKDRMSDASTLFGSSNDSALSVFNNTSAVDESLRSPNNLTTESGDNAIFFPTVNKANETDKLSNTPALPLTSNRSGVDVSSLFSNVNSSADPFALPPTAPLAQFSNSSDLALQSTIVRTNASLGVAPPLSTSHPHSRSSGNVQSNSNAFVELAVPVPVNPSQVKKSPSSQSLTSIGIPIVPGVKYVPPQATLPPELSRSSSAPTPPAVTSFPTSINLSSGDIHGGQSSSKSDTTADSRKASPVPTSVSNPASIPKPQNNLVSLGFAPPSIPGIPSKPVNIPASLPNPVFGSSIPDPNILVPNFTQPSNAEPTSATIWKPAQSTNQQTASKHVTHSRPPTGSSIDRQSTAKPSIPIHLPIPNTGSKPVHEESIMKLQIDEKPESKTMITTGQFEQPPFERKENESLSLPTVPIEGMKQETAKPMSFTPPSIHGINYSSSSDSSKISAHQSQILPAVSIKIPTDSRPLPAPPAFVPFTKTSVVNSQVSAMGIDTVQTKMSPPTIVPLRQSVPGFPGFSSSTLSPSNPTNRQIFPSRGCPVVSFGFGGKIAVMIPQVTQQLRPMRCGPVIVHRIGDILKRQSTISTSSASASEPTGIAAELKLFFDGLESFPGPLAPTKLPSGSSKATSTTLEQSIFNFISQRIEIPISSFLSDEYFETARVCSRNAMVSSERSAWILLQFLVSTKGSVSSLNPESVSSSQSPESKIIKLIVGSTGSGSEAESLSSLLPTMSSISTSLRPQMTSLFESMRDNFASCPSVDDIMQIENLLALGQREAAIEIAVQKKIWPLAFLISSICGAQIYQRTVQQYINCSIVGGTPLHVLSLIYSNQSSVLKAPISQSMSTYLSMHSSWRRIFAAWLMNKGHDWEHVGRILGDRIYQDERDVMACDIFYICAKCLPSLPLPRSSLDPKTTQRGKYSLLGSLPMHDYCSLIDPYALSSFRMTEIFEYALNLGAKQEDSTSNSSGDRGLSGWFGFGSNSNSATSATSAASTGTADAPQYDYISTEQMTQMKATFCFTKIRFAYLLAELGYFPLAMKYAVYVKDVAASLETMSSKPPAPTKSSNHQPNSQSHESTHHGIRPFKKKFVQDVDDFIDRLIALEGKAKGSTSFDSTNQQASADNSAKWGISSIVNVLSSSTLKELVDGSTPQDIPSTTSRPSNYPQQHSVKSHFIPHAGVGLETNSATNSTLPPNSQASFIFSAPAPPLPMPFMNPNATSSSSTNDSKFHRSQSTGSIQSAGPATFQTTGNQLPSSKNDSAHQPPAQAQQPIPPQLPIQPQQHIQPEHPINRQQFSKEFEDKKVSQDSQTPQSPSAPSSSSTGIFGKIKKNIVSWLHPDAHSADENLGDGLKAYYDKATGRWVFPGEEGKAPEPSLGPPPVIATPEKATFPMPSSENNLSSQTGSNSYDPIAALMAPPPRSASYGVSLSAMDTTAASNADPMAALMAPPMRRVGTSVPNFSSPAKQSVPNIAVWKPPSATKSTAPLLSEGQIRESSTSYLNNSASTDRPDAESTNNQQIPPVDITSQEDFSTIPLS